MSTISTPQQVQYYYQQQEVAQKYIQKRFTEPLNIVEHQRHVQILNKIIKEQKIKKVLEFAPGPARLTAELRADSGTSIDSSASMLEIAQRRMQAAGKRWNFMQGNILTIKLKPEHDFVFCIRFLLHFQHAEREKIYAQAKSALRPGGYLAFEVMNKKVVQPLRKTVGMKHYIVYDKLYTRSELIMELKKNGFKVLKLYPILNHFWLQAFFSRPLKFMNAPKLAAKIINSIEKYASLQPYEWIVLCQKK